ncbi:hypothetical protein B0H14DRAFT_2599562 [Mycena olivaceomarginata]|nr:hypothetical protein B0H14DRAFT_2599562 [Mycena olivaceomarginata]
MSTPYAAPRCELQRGRLLPLAEALKLHRLLKRYLSRAIAVRKSFKLTQELEISFTEMYELFDGADGEAWPALPPNAGGLHDYVNMAVLCSDMLTCIRKFLQQLIPGDLPDEPTELLNVPSPETNEFDIDLQSDVSELYEGNDGITCQDALDPDESMLKLVVPRTDTTLCREGVAPNAAAFKFSDYQFQHSAYTFRAYSVATEKYTAANLAISLVSWGRCMIYLRDTIDPSHTPRLKTWTRRARDSADEEHGNNNFAPSSPIPQPIPAMITRAAGSSPSLFLPGSWVLVERVRGVPNKKGFNFNVSMAWTRIERVLSTR